MGTLDTVQDYVNAGRVLLQDTVAPYRYPDTDMVFALSLAVSSARRLRPDLFIGRATAVPNYTTNDTTAVAIDPQYRSAILYYIIGHTQLRDEEDTQDARAAGLLGKFTSQMLSLG